MIDPVAFRFGPFSVRWYALIISMGMVLGIILTLRESKKKGIREDFFLDFFLLGIPLAIIGARAYYVLFRWSYFSQNPARIIAIWEGGLAIHGGIIAGSLVLLFLVYRRGVDFWQAVDILAPALILGQAIGRWGNFINQEAFGGKVSQEFISRFPEFIKQQMYIGGAYRQPTFLYMSVWNFLVFALLLWIRRKEFIKTGDVFLTYLITYSLGRFFVEGLRTDSLYLGPFRIAQLLSVVLIIVSSFLIYKRHQKGDLS
ncbi:MAG: prolipoprotein diacylglyceryl transferase [Halanaerobiaceae bacterium]